MEKLLEAAQAGHMSWWSRILGNHQGGVNGVTQGNGELRFAVHLHLQAEWKEGLTEEQWYLPVFPSPEKAAPTPAPPAFSLKRQFSSSPCTPVLPPLHWSAEPVNLRSKFMCGPLRTPGAPVALHLSWMQSPLIFIARCYGDFFSQH